MTTVASDPTLRDAMAEVDALCTADATGWPEPARSATDRLRSTVQSAANACSARLGRATLRLRRNTPNFAEFREGLREGLHEVWAATRAFAPLLILLFACAAVEIGGPVWDSIVGRLPLRSVPSYTTVARSPLVHEVYDAFRDETNITADIRLDAEHTLLLVASHPGRGHARPDRLSAAASADTHLHRAVVRWSIGEAEFLLDPGSEHPTRFTWEGGVDLNVRSTPVIEQLLAIAGAHQAAVRIDGTAVPIGPDARAAIRDFLSRMRP